MGAGFFGNVDSSKGNAQWQPAPAATATRQPDQPHLKHQMSQSSSSYHRGDDQLFHTPSDLVCPITLSLFSDPVCNAVGQVYERSAIQRHLVQAAVNGQPPTDPISNAVLPSLDLVPVYPMKSRAAQYRESASRACVQIAAAPDCPDPVRYLRRAAELVIMAADSTSSNSGVSSGSITPTSSFPSTAVLPPSSAGLAGAAANAGAAAANSMAISFPGMTLEFARYLAAHQDSAYDALVLKYFGNELLRAGCADAAADVFYRLLLEADDCVQQAEYMQLCLDCWTSSSSSTEAPSGAEPAAAAAGGSSARSSSSTTTPGTPRTSSSGSGPPATQQQQAPQQQQQQPLSGPAAAAAAAANPHIIGRLADFVQRQRVLSPSAIVHMLQSMNHGPHMAMQLCQLLLARASAAAAAAAAPESEAALGLPGGMGGVLEVLTSLLDLRQTLYQQQLQGLAAQLQALEAAHRQQQSAHGVLAPSAEGAANTRGSSSMDATGEAAGGGAGDKSKAAQGSRSRRKQGASWKGGKGLDVVLGRVARLAAAGTLAAASLVGGDHPLLRVARVGPLMYLLRAGL